MTSALNIVDALKANHGVSVNDIVDPKGWGLVSIFSLNGNLDAIAALRMRGADPNLKNTDGQTPNDIATTHDLYGCFTEQMLLETPPDADFLTFASVFLEKKGAARFTISSMMSGTRASPV